VTGTDNIDNFLQLLQDLVLANHILHHHGVVDAFGHVSIRHPTRHEIFIMSSNMAPALVRSPADFVEYNVADAQPAGNVHAKGFVERYIHSEIYKRYAGVMCVVHAHADDVMPYAVSGVPLRAMSHMAGFLGEGGALTFDIERHYKHGDAHDLLISNPRLGLALAEFFSWAGHRAELPEQALVLMRKHGFTVWGRSIQEAVYRAVYATKNARLQTQAAAVRSGFEALQGDSKGWLGGRPAKVTDGLESLSAEQARDAEAANLRAAQRPWGLWVQEVKCLPLYTSPVFGI
jgi:ribulose-5-phosphate 4-epimerase/fuculose-1-phosphate aldolase